MNYVQFDIYTRIPITIQYKIYAPNTFSTYVSIDKTFIYLLEHKQT